VRPASLAFAVVLLSASSATLGAPCYVVFDRNDDLPQDHHQQCVLAVEVGVEGAHAEARVLRQVAQAHRMEALGVGERQGRLDDAGKIGDRDGGFPDADGGLMAFQHAGAQRFHRQVEPLLKLQQGAHFVSIRV